MGLHVYTYKPHLYMPKKSLSEQGIIHLFSQQRQIHHLLNVTHIMEHQAFQILRFDLIDIFSFSLQRINSLIPARLAAKIFSLIPPTGSTLPRNVISPVIAKFFFHLTLSKGGDKRKSPSLFRHSVRLSGSPPPVRGHAHSSSRTTPR